MEKSIKDQADFKSKLQYSALIFVSVAIISIISVQNGSFYDDEIYNINSVTENDAASLWRYINAADVHPPGSYLINKLLFALLGSWESVKIFGGILNGLGLAVFAFLAFGKINAAMRWPLALLLMASGTHIMWGASVRWYAYFNPIFTIALGIILFSTISVTKRTLVLGASIILLFYLSYAAFCAAPVLLLAHVSREKWRLKRNDIVLLILVGFVSFLVCLPQLNNLIHVQLLSQAKQTGSFFSALIQVAITLLVGNAVFPIAILPAIYTAAVLALVLFFIFLKPKSQLDWIALAALTVGALAMAASGIGIKPRNSVFLLPLIFLIVSSSIAALPKPLSRGAIALVALFQIAGITNVIEHRGTLKGSFDTNYNSAIATIRAWKKQCRGDVFVFHHDVVFGYLLDASSIKNSSPFSSSKATQFDFTDGDCVIFVKTFHGGFDSGTIASYFQSTQAPGLEPTGIQRISEDPGAAAKSWIAKESFPQYLIVLYRYEVHSKVSLPAWNFTRVGNTAN